MKVGDLIWVPPCPPMPEEWGDCGCPCFFCTNNSSRYGIVVSKAPYKNSDRWFTMFDCGGWDINETDDVEVLSGDR